MAGCASLLIQLLSVNGGVCNPSPKTGQDLTSLAMSTIVLYEKMGQMFIVCIRRVILHCQLQPNLKKLSNVNRKKVILLNNQIEHRIRNNVITKGNATIQVPAFISGWTYSRVNEHVWCMQDKDAKHPNRSRNKLFRIGTHSAWHTFKCQPVCFIEDSELRNRLIRLIESTSAMSDPFANDIMYHHACWLK